jgi:hypothetical protein
MTIATMSTDTDNARDCALSIATHITRLLRLRDRCNAAGHCDWADQIQQQIDELPLAILVRSDWHAPGDTGETDEYCIELATGGPAVRITGSLNNYDEPADARLQCCDWGTPWRDVDTSVIFLREFACNFYFGA